MKFIFEFLINTLIQCTYCLIQFQDSIRGSRNFNPAFIVGSKNLRASVFKHHAKSDMHRHAMQLFKKSESKNVTEHARIDRFIVL